MSKIICYCKNVTEEEIQKAIDKGATRISDIEWETGACTGNQCKELNPSGECCIKDVKKMIGHVGGPTCSCCG